MKTIKACDLPFWAQDFLDKFMEYPEWKVSVYSLEGIAQLVLDMSDWSGDEIDPLYTEGQNFIKYLTGWGNLSPKDIFKFDWSEE